MANALASARAGMKKAGKPMKLGNGGRFAALKAKLAGRAGVSNPAALAASIGRKKLGSARFKSLAAKGRARN